jgi:DNA polymerase III delta prime subunit
MDSPSAPSYAATANNAAATLYIVPRAIDRLATGRRLAAPLLSGSESDASLAMRGAHPDLIELAPPEKKQRIGIDQVREVIRFAQFSPVQAKRKVCLIPRAETLTPEAANALLKIMEEPPRDLAFVVLAEHPSDMLPTIVSRCRMVRIPPSTRDAIARRLMDAGHAEADAAWLARVALRDGDLDRLTEAKLDVGAARDSAAAGLRESAVTDLIAAALGDDPIRRYEALLLLIAGIGAQDTDLLTVGVRALANQARDTLPRFLQELLAVCFDLIRSSFDTADDQRPHAEIRERIGTERLRGFCRAIDNAHRSVAVYGPPEAVLLSLMLTPGDDVHGE